MSHPGSVTVERRVSLSLISISFFQVFLVALAGSALPLDIAYDGRYSQDDSGRYIADDSGRYIPDNSGDYIHDDSGKDNLIRKYK